MLGTGIILLLAVSVAVSVLCALVSRNVGGNGAILVVCAGALFMVLLCLVMFHLPQRSNLEETDTHFQDKEVH